MRLYGLIGYPLGHSFSSSYFERKFRAEGINAAYRNFPLEQLSAFKPLLEMEQGLAGLNVTVPYKQAIIPHLDRLSDVSQVIRAVNTISVHREGAKIETAGDNTDVYGFRRSLTEHLKPHHTSALVLGTGGSSRAVQHVLDRMGIGITLVSRSLTAEKVSPVELAGHFRRITYSGLDSRTVRDTKLIINTTPLGMYPNVTACPDIPYTLLTPDHLLFDLVYNPAVTEFLARGKKMGAAVVNGYDMLIFQAEASWKIWNTGTK